MNYLVWLVPIALGMGLVGLAAFLWSMRNGQLEDLDGAAQRVLLTHGSDLAPVHDETHPNAPPASNPESDGKQSEVRS
jgi:cbb3-type cytochrome oxidase maturation protein